MNMNQIDNYLRCHFPGGSVLIASLYLGKTEAFIKRRVMYLKIDANMIFETVSYFKDEKKKVY